MTIVGWHASHEQIPPSRLLDAVRRAEAAGFDAAMSSDHIAPWSARQGESGFAWSWLGAAMGATRLPFGVVNAPGQRYHPAIVAQAIATLGEMFPDRLWVAMGSGENANEHITGAPWPDKATRNRRLLECVEVIRALLAGDEVTHHGLVTVDQARVWSRPAQPPALLATAVSVETARWAAGWADGLLTLARAPGALRPVVDGYRDAGGAGPVYVQAHVSWAPTDAEASAIAHDQWRTNVFDPPTCWDLARVEHFDAAAAHVGPEVVAEHVIVASDPAEHLERLAAIVAVGCDGIWVHHVGQQQDAFIDTFGEHVVPALRGMRP